MNFSELNTVAVFKQFLTEYHKMLQTERSFPPLGIGKALHTAAPLFNVNNWDELAANIKNVPAATGKSDEDRKNVVPLIPAEAHSDDFYVEVPFNAVLWFEQAKDQQIKDLADCDWRGDYPADYVAEKSVEWFPEIQRVFDHHNPNPDLGGFECSVNEEAALAWLMVNRPALYAEITAEDIPAPSVPEKRQVVAIVTVEKGNMDDGAPSFIDMQMVGSWDEAEEAIADMVRSKVMHNDRDADEMRDCRNISVPDDEDLEEDYDDSDVMEWIIKHNNIHNLVSFVEYLDYNLTSIELKENWI